MHRIEIAQQTPLIFQNDNSKALQQNHYALLCALYRYDAPEKSPFTRIYIYSIRQIFNKLINNLPDRMHIKFNLNLLENVHHIKTSQLKTYN